MSSRRRQPVRDAKNPISEDQSTDTLSAPLSRRSPANRTNNHQSLPSDALSEASQAPPSERVKPSSEDATDTPSAQSKPQERLASIKPRNGSTSTGSPANASEEPVRSNLVKFKPRSNFRRSQAQREEMERAEAERQATRHIHDASISPRGKPYGQRSGRGGFVARQQSRGSEGRESLASGVLGGDVVREHVPKPRRSRGGGHSHGSERGTSVQRMEPGEKKGVSSGVKKEDGAKTDAKKDGRDVTMKPTARNRKALNAKTKVKKEEEEEFNYISDEAQWDDDPEPKMNIEHINLISDDETEDTRTELSETAKGKQRERPAKLPSWQLRPVRLERQEHVERQIAINTDASSLTSAELRRRAKERQTATGSLFLPVKDAAEIINSTVAKAKRKPRDVEFVRNERRWKGVYEDDEDRDVVMIKKEPGDDRDAALVSESVIRDLHREPMDIDEEQAVAGTDASSVDERRPFMEIENIAIQPEGRADTGEKPMTPPPLRRPKICGYRDVKSIHEAENNTDDDADLAEIIQIWKEFQVDEPDYHASSADTSTQHTHTDGSSKDSIFKGNPDRQNNVYLVQLPPVLPSLRDSSKPLPKIKTEEKGKPKISAQERITNPLSTPIKPDPDFKDEPAEGLQDASVTNAYTATSLSPPSGCPGLLTMYESGKIIADWGGISLDIKQSVQAGFAQEILVYNHDAVNTKVEDESRFEENVSVGDKAWAVGNIEGSFVGSLDWESLLG